MMQKKNIILFDNDPEEVEEFVTALQEFTGEKWMPIFAKSNGLRNTPWRKFRRYLTYFWFPFKIFLQRKHYGKILAWQQFYGLLFALYSRLFCVKKMNPLYVNVFIYKPKRGLIGKFYFWFMRTTLASTYINVCSIASKKHLEYSKTIFSSYKEKIVYIKYGMQDFSALNKIAHTSINGNMPKDFVLSIGRSNRDYQFLLNAWETIQYPLVILCDELHTETTSTNIHIFNQITGTDAWIFYEKAKCIVIPITNPEIDGGQSVAINSFSFGKPVLIATSSTLPDENIDNGIDGIVIEKKSSDLLEALESIYGDAEFYQKLCRNAREKYENKYSLRSYAKNWSVYL
jgi:glycosyltransferase involved in cell wall biosynthesis